MEQILAFVERHFALLSAIGVVYVGGAFALEWRRNKRNGIRFPEPSEVAILFIERRASGRSLQSLMSRLGGARGVLEVIVTSDELWIRVPMPFGIMAPRLDLVHRIPLTAVVKRARTGKRVWLEFPRQDGSVAGFELMLRDAAGFEGALTMASGGGPSPTSQPDR